MTSQKIEDGVIKYKQGRKSKKEFYVDKTKPILLKSGLFESYQPFYVIKWDKVCPITFEKDSKGGVKTEVKYTPESLQQLSDMKILSQLLSLTGSKQGLLLILVGGLFGFVVSAFLFMSGIIEMG
jgi:hypothetical protein